MPGGGVSLSVSRGPPPPPELLELLAQLVLAWLPATFGGV